MRPRLYLVRLDARGEDRPGERLVLPRVPLSARAWVRVAVVAAAAVLGAGLALAWGW